MTIAIIILLWWVWTLQSDVEQLQATAPDDDYDSDDYSDDYGFDIYDSDD